MGMYTDVRISFVLGKHTPPEIHVVLGYLVKGDHDLKGMGEKDTRELKALVAKVGSRVHHMLCSGENLVTGGEPVTACSYDEAFERWNFTIVRSIKNNNKEWESFIEWLAPHVDAQIGVCEGDFLVLGTMMYEEWDYPKLILVRDGKVKYQWIVVEEHKDE